LRDPANPGDLCGIFGIWRFRHRPRHNWAHRLPTDLPRVQEKLQFLSGPAKAVTDVLHKAETFGQGDQAKSSTLPNIDFASILFRGTRHFASGLFETILVLFFLLVSGGTFLRKLVEIMPSFKDKRQVVDLSQQIESNISAYLLTITMMNAAVGTATGLIMWLTGVGDPILWGVVAFFSQLRPDYRAIFWSYSVPGHRLDRHADDFVGPAAGCPLFAGPCPRRRNNHPHAAGSSIYAQPSAGDHFVDLLVLDVGRAWGNSVCANVGDHQDCMRRRRAFERNRALSRRRDWVAPRGYGR
jgi:AI-2E family transporter